MLSKLNKIIDGNTAIIKMNKDSCVQQKMTIGDYKTAFNLQLTTTNQQKILNS
jgi:hypothetical protein